MTAWSHPGRISGGLRNADHEASSRSCWSAEGVGFEPTSKVTPASGFQVSITAYQRVLPHAVWLVFRQLTEVIPAKTVITCPGATNGVLVASRSHSSITNRPNDLAISLFSQRAAAALQRTRRP